MQRAGTNAATSRTLATRDRIVRSAVELLEERPSSDVTIDDIARRAGVSVRTVYRYYPSKPAIVVESRPHEIEQFIAALERYPPTIHPVDAILTTLAASVAGDDHDNDFDRRHVAVILRHDDLRAAFLAAVGRAETQLANWLSRRQPDADDPLSVRTQAALLATAYRVLVETIAERGTSEYAATAAQIFGAIRDLVVDTPGEWRAAGGSTPTS